MKYCGIFVSVFLFVSGSDAFLGNIFEGWGVNVGGSAGVGGVGAGTGLSIGNPQTNQGGKDYSGGTGAGVGGTLSLGPFGSIDLGIGLGSGGSRPTTNVPKAGVWSWLPKLGYENSPQFVSAIRGLFDRFPLFKGIENSDSPAAFASIYSSLQNNPSLLSQILAYIGTLGSDAQQGVLFVLNKVISGVPGGDINIDALPSADSNAKSQYRLLISSLSPTSKQMVRFALSTLPPHEQEKAFNYLIKTYGGSMGQSGVQININPSTLQNVIKVATTQEVVRDYEGISVGGGGGSGSISGGGGSGSISGGGGGGGGVITIQNIFVDQPQMQSTLNTFWSRLTPETEVSLRRALASLDNRGQQSILTYLINASSSILSQPRTKIVFDDASIQNVVTMYKENMLGSANVQVVEV